MLVVKIELHSAITGKITTIGQMVVANAGGTKQRGHYAVRVARKPDADKRPGDWMMKAARHGEVRDYPRLSYNVWRLIARAILSAFPEERGR